MKSLTAEEISFISEYYTSNTLQEILGNLMTLKKETPEESDFIENLIEKLLSYTPDDLAAALNEPTLTIDISED